MIARHEPGNTTSLPMHAREATAALEERVESIDFPGAVTCPVCRVADGIATVVARRSLSPAGAGIARGQTPRLVAIGPEHAVPT